MILLALLCCFQPTHLYIYIDDVIDALGCHRYVIKSEINAGQLNLGGN